MRNPVHRERVVLGQELQRLPQQHALANSRGAAQPVNTNPGIDLLIGVLEKRPDVVGSAVQVNGNPAVIIGVMPEEFVLVYEQDLWMPTLSDAETVGDVRAALTTGADALQDALGEAQQTYECETTAASPS